MASTNFEDQLSRARATIFTERVISGFCVIVMVTGLVEMDLPESV